MSDFSTDDFEEILDSIKHKISDFVLCDDIRSIESNFNTKGMVFKVKNNPRKDGTVIVGEDNGVIAVDISLADNAVRNFILDDKNDIDGIKNIVGWFEENYRLEESLR
ncbi:hypothetical protein [Clostridium magnum]|uniref:Uncharacterized protein n=1 Tax=Clostridium magnum DSM 2767 TaxID=1121326 RepID=A0A161X908_9CLOT|nr:hypothetical protein [Clostridium magnum]KZL90696.1 hypothetical protein CLMAG_35970 [Clostridium magnum DSM 2767]SHI40629.1 hypothetical protein SAMN02745944_04263 [Clostridium magnum DSM 2767]